MDYNKHSKWRKSFPYYKVQYWDNNTRAWRDIQKSFDTPSKARHYGISLARKFRIMIINREGRNVL